MVQKDVVPVLTTAEIDDLLLQALRVDANGYTPTSIWAASTIYTVQSVRVPTVGNGHLYIVTTAGTSGASQPTWPVTGGATVTDGTVVWTERGAYLYTATYDLRAAAAEGWRWKAAKVAAQYDAAVGDGTSFTRSQQFQHCMAMAANYASGGIGSVKLLGSWGS